jgi:hypothetical protein
MAEILTRSQSPITHKIFWNSYVVNVPYQYTDRNRTLRLRWEYNVGGISVIKDDEVYVVTSYIDFNHVQDMEFSTDSSDPNYKSYKELLKAERYARKVIEQYTGQKFYLYDDLYVVYGYDSDTLPLPARIAEIHELYANDILLLDTLNDIDNWNYPVEVSESGYGIRVNRAGLLDNTVYTANGMVPLDSVLSMNLDVYKQFEIQDPDTGAIVREWNYYRTVPCHVKGVISNSATTRSSDKQLFSNKYVNDQIVQVRTIERLTIREKVTNIRDSQGNTIWTEINYPNDTPTVFEVMGTTPVTDPFGRVIGYNSSMKRSENQQIGQ